MKLFDYVGMGLLDGKRDPACCWQIDLERLLEIGSESE
jgi:hypothetical protein